MIVYTYTISTTFTGGLSQDDLDSELHVAFAEFMHLSTSGDTIKLTFSAAVSVPALDAALAAHNPNLLDTLKRTRAGQVDARTSELIDAGFTYAGLTFSLSLTAQANWLGVLSSGAAAGLPYPDYPVATIDNGYYLAANEAEMVLIAQAAMNRKGWAVATGAVLKKQIKDAADEVALDAILDTR